jgi:hypothetical protein
MQSQNDGPALPLQTVKGPHTTYAVQKSEGWAYTVSQDCLARYQTFSLSWPEMPI